MTITSQLCTQIQLETSTKEEVGYLVFSPFLGREDGHHLVQCHDGIYVDVPHARSPPPRAVTLYLLSSFSLFLLALFAISRLLGNVQWPPPSLAIDLSCPSLV